MEVFCKALINSPTNLPRLKLFPKSFQRHSKMNIEKKSGNPILHRPQEGNTKKIITC
jgi:hypothetical protein